MSVARWVRACAGMGVVVLSLAACGSSPSATEGLVNVSDAGAPAGVGIPDTVPGSPEIWKADRSGPGMVEVWWYPPARNGGSAITGYTVTSSPGGLTFAGTVGTWGGPGYINVIVGGLHVMSVTGLTIGVPYTFTVTATNAAGTSAASEATRRYSVEPGPPTDVWANGSWNSAAVGWQAPGDDGGSAITGYTMTASPSGTTNSTEDGASGWVYGLYGGWYTFTVTATNGLGTSLPSAPSNAASVSARAGYSLQGVDPRNR